MSAPLLSVIPESFETERLLIRAPLPGDGAAVNHAIRDSIDELRPWMPWAQAVPSVEQSEENILQAQQKFLDRTDLRLLLIHKETGQLIGSSGLHRIDWTVRAFEIGYWVRSTEARHGYITEAVRGIARYAIDELGANRIEIRCDARNIRSENVARRSGFTLEGILRNEKRGMDGTLRNTLLFSRVRGVEY